MALWATSPDPYQKKTKQKTRKQTKKTNKQKLIGRVEGQVRWPFGPPHLTLKPQKTNKKTRKTRIPPKITFQLSVHFLVGVQNSPYWQLGLKNAHLKNTINIEVSATHFLKNGCAWQSRHFWPRKKTQNKSFSYHFLFAFFSCNNKTRKNALKPYFIVFYQPKKLSLISVSYVFSYCFCCCFWASNISRVCLNCFAMLYAESSFFKKSDGKMWDIVLV